MFAIDLASRRLLRSYGRADGLPDWPVDELLSNGRTLWIVHRRGLATLNLDDADARITDREGGRFRFARLHRDEGGVWAIADDATYRFAEGRAEARRGPALPTGRRMTDTLRTGVWLARRKQHTAYFAADPVSRAGRLYVASFGAIYELADGRWSRVAAEGWSPRTGHGCLWFLTTRGLTQYTPGTKKLEYWASIVLGVVLILMGASGSAFLLGVILGVALISAGLQQWRAAAGHP